MTTAEHETRACVACGGAVDPIANHALRKDGFDLVSCPSCGMLMRASLPAVADLDEIYGPEYFTYAPDNPVDGYADYVGDADSHRRAARRRLALIGRFAPSRGRLLDVGAAAGFFIDEANAAGWDAEGIDIPAGEVAKSHELLAPGGLLGLSTGDIDSTAARLSRSRWHLLTPRHHNFFFSFRTLSRLLDRSGFEIAWYGHPGSRYSLAHLAYKLDRVARSRVTAAAARRIAASRFGRYTFPLNLFDIVTVIARKGG
jgi:hypothetical protein